MGLPVCLGHHNVLGSMEGNYPLIMVEYSWYETVVYLARMLGYMQTYVQSMDSPHPDPCIALSLVLVLLGCFLCVGFLVNTPSKLFDILYLLKKMGPLSPIDLI